MTRAPGASPLTFLSRASDQARATIAAIEALAAAEGSDHAVRAYAAAVADRHRAEWAGRYDLRESRRATKCWCALAPKPALVGHKTYHLPPEAFGDHGTLWNFDGKPVAFVGQPYGLGDASVRELAAVCDAHGLEFTIDTWPAWHFPGAVLGVQVWRRGERQRVADLVRARRAEAPPR